MNPVRLLQVSPALPVDVCAQAAALSAKGWLTQLFTSAAYAASEESAGLMSQWMGRRKVAVRSEELHPVYLSDVSERLRLLAGMSPVEAADCRFRRVDLVASRYVNDSLDAVLCREDAAAHTFSRAEKHGVLRIYDLPTAHFQFTRRLMAREVETFPELERSISMSDEYSAHRSSSKEKDLESADHILCPSQFVKRTLVAAGLASEKIHVHSFACDPGWLERSTLSPANVVLSVGQLSVRKGVHRLLKVWKQLGAYRTHTLRLIGDMRLPDSYLRQFNGLYEHVGKLPRQELISEYATAKFFVANAMSEGMALVIPEAISAGTPVIASRNSGAEEIITHNEEGLLVDYGDDEALADSIDRLLGSPDLLAYMRKKAAIKAQSRTWSDYSRGFITWVDSLLAEKSMARSA